jgi:hypothetical protein
MSERLLQHHPTPTPIKSVDALDRQRIYDQRIMQDNVSRIFDQLADKDHLDSFLLEDIAIGLTETLVEHKLNRTIRGWHMVRKNGLGDVYDTIDTTTSDLTRYLPLKSSVAVTISLVVF